MVGSDDGQTFARPCLTLRGKHGTEVGHVAALHADEATALHAEANLIVGKGAEVAILVEHLNGDMGYVGWDGTERRSVNSSPQPGWCTGRTDDVLVGLAVALAYYFDFAWLVFYIPSQVQVGSSGKMLAGGVG